MELTLRQLQLLELEIACEIKRICYKHDISYFLAGGTLLGAVRHGGFIPWDDDMDIGMIREDYDKFIHCAIDSLGERFVLQTWDENSPYAFPFTKIRLKHTHIVEKISEGVKMEDGVWVDVFPYDSITEEAVNSKRCLYTLGLWSKAILLKNGYQLNRITENRSSRLINLCLKAAVGLTSSRRLKKILERQLLKYGNDRGSWYLECDGRFRGEFSFPKAYLMELIEMEFEHISFKVPKEYQLYLNKAYGDYNTLPSAGERGNGHSVVKIVLDRDYESYFK